MTRAEKRCARCRFWFPFAAFDRDGNGHQSWCKECKDSWETTADGVHSRLLEALEKVEPESVHLWTLEAFNRRWLECGGKCTYCGNGLRAYQKSGMTLDRMDSKDRRHTPDTAVLCCWPCNRQKGDMEYGEWLHFINGLRARHHGTVNWGAVNSRWKLVVRRTTYHLRAHPPQTSLALEVTR